MTIIRDKSDPVLSDFKDVCDDISRTERLLKELEKAGRIVRIGRAANAKYVLGDDDQEDT